MILKNGFAVTSAVRGVPHFVYVVTVFFCFVAFTHAFFVVKFLVGCAIVCAGDAITTTGVFVPGLFLWIAIALLSDTIAATRSVIVDDSTGNIKLVAYYFKYVNINGVLCCYSAVLGLLIGRATSSAAVEDDIIRVGANVNTLWYSEGDWSRLTMAFAWNVWQVVYCQNTIITLVPSLLSVKIPVS